MASWPPSDEVITTWFQERCAPKGKGKGDYPDNENLFYYALDKCVNAAGGKEFGARYIMEPARWEIKPYMDDEVKSAMRHMIDEMDNQPLTSRQLGHFDRREYINYKQFCDVVGCLLDQNENDAEVVELCFQMTLASCKFEPNRGMFRAVRNIRDMAKNMSTPSAKAVYKTLI
mmetsp:Transcript_46574/g.87194  ORF Transcript_46574/g.87194 Transcript_46574/m.87194 type:complete len:173 (-) Transcript_46574:118-636(-)